MINLPDNSSLILYLTLVQLFWVLHAEILVVCGHCKKEILMNFTEGSKIQSRWYLSLLSALTELGIVCLLTHTIL